MRTSDMLPSVALLGGEDAYATEAAVDPEADPATDAADPAIDVAGAADTEADPAADGGRSCQSSFCEQLLEGESGDR